MIVNSVSDIDSKMHGLPKEALVIFDVDQVLVDPFDAILRGCGDTLRVALLKDLGKRLGIERAHELYSIIFCHRKLGLVEEKMPLLIKGLIAKGLKVIALTRFPTGKFGRISSMENWREKELFDLGFNFSTSFKAFPEISLSVMEERSDAQIPRFQSGILYTGGGGLYPPSQNKAETLCAFLRHIAWYPKHISFVDDLETHLAALGAFCQTEKIPYQALHYQAARKAGSTLDEALARFQFQYLEAQEEWLADAEADRQFS